MPYPWEPAIVQTMQQHGGRNQRRPLADSAARGEDARSAIPSPDLVPAHEEKADAQPPRENAGD